MTYLINFFLVPLYYLIIRKNADDKKLSKDIFFFVATLHAILFRALANPFNYVDTEGYAFAFNYISDMTFNEAVLSPNIYSEWGLGYIALNWFFSRLTSDSIYLFVILAIISVGGVMLFYKKMAYNPLLAVILYLSYPMMYIMGFGVVRQHLAIVFVLWALYFVDNLKISVTLAVIASLFHTSAIVFFPYFFLKNIDLRQLTLFKVLFYSILGFTILSITIAYVLPFFSRYNKIYESKDGNNNIVPVILIGSLLLFYFITGTYKRVKSSHDMYIIRFLIYGLIIGLFSIGTPGAGRLTLYFIYTLPIAICLPFKYAKPEMKAISTMYLIGLFFLVSLLIFYASEKYENYQFFWEYV